MDSCLPTLFEGARSFVGRNCLVVAISMFAISMVSVSSVAGQEFGQPPQPDDKNLSEMFVDSVSVFLRQIEQQYDPPISLKPIEEHVHAAVQHLNSLHREWRLIRQYELKRQPRLGINHPQLASPDAGVYGGKYFPPIGDR